MSSDDPEDQHGSNSRSAGEAVKASNPSGPSTEAEEALLVVADPSTDGREGSNPLGLGTEAYGDRMPQGDLAHSLMAREDWAEASRGGPRDRPAARPTSRGAAPKASRAPRYARPFTALAPGDLSLSPHESGLRAAQLIRAGWPSQHPRVAALIDDSCS